jgi:thiol-disulfide isomerase/thioredoxin
MLPMRAALLIALASAPVWGSLEEDVHALVAHGDLAGAEREVRAAQSKLGATAEFAAAESWLARGALAARQIDRAEAYAAQARTLGMRVLGMRRIDSDPWLPTAIGASIEVHAEILAVRGQTAEAIVFLQEQLKAWGGTSLHERIRKNINLLSLEGKPAPPLEGINLAALKGRPVLLFFWAHWCPDCKADVPVVAAVERRFRPQGLALIGPTRLYGYAQGGEPAPPAAEKQYIEQVRRQYYAPLATMPAPLSAANFQAYGASTTPTLVLVDRAGIVRFYHPGAVTEPELTARIQSLLR